MTRFALRRPLAITVALVAVTAMSAVARAQTSAAPTGNFGGGTLAVPVSEKTVAKDMLLSIRSVAGGRIGVDGQMFAGCGIGTITGDAKLAADGSFALTGKVTRKPLVSVRQTTSFTVKGTLTADGGQGTASMKLSVSAKGHKARSCSSHTVSWTVRRPVATGAAPAAAPTDNLLYGLTSQSGPRAKRAIVLHTASGGRRIDRLTFGFRSTCSQKRIIAADDVDISPEFDVAADGSFREVERFKVTYSDVVANTTVVVRGQFDEAGGAAGKLAVTERYTSRKSGKRVDECVTGTRSWSAHT
jgi:hypothetical protein